MKLNFKNFDWGLFLAMALLLSFGLLVIYSISPSSAKQQLLFALVGLFFYFFILSFDYNILGTFAFILYFLNLLFLVSTYFFGEATHGAVRWFSLGGLTFQPSEISKLVVILVLGAFFVSRFWNGSSPGSFIFSFLVAAAPAVLVFLQPDLGTALVLLAVWGGMVLVARVRPFWLFCLALTAAIFSAPLFFVLKEYQRQRLLTFFNPTRDPLGSGYHVIQSMIAIGSGRLFGRGFGRGTQSHLKFLPAYHTDFVFATLAEEWGFLGSVLFLVLVGFLLWRMLRIAKTAADDFGVLLALGVFSMIFFQVAVNVGMNLGLSPITGIPLPLVSSGGSSLVATLTALGLVQSVALRRKL